APSLCSNSSGSSKYRSSRSRWHQRVVDRRRSSVSIKPTSDASLGNPSLAWFTRRHMEKMDTYRRKRPQFLQKRATSNSSFIFFQSWGIMRMAFLQVSIEPSSGNIPFTHHRFGRDAKQFCGLSYGQATEVAKLNNPSLTRIK